MLLIFQVPFGSDSSSCCCSSTHTNRYHPSVTFQEDILLWSVLIFSGVCAFPSISLFSFNSLISLWFRAFPRRTFMFYAFQQRHKHCYAASWEICLLAFLLSVRWKDGYHSRIFLFNTKLQPAAHQGAFKTVWQQQWCKFIASHSVCVRERRL